METTHIRVTKEMKEKLDDTKGQNYDERIKNYSQALTNDVNKNVNNSEQLQELIELIKDVNKNVNSIETMDKSDIRNALPTGSY